MNSPELLLRSRDTGPAVAAAEGPSWLEEASLQGNMHPGGQTLYQQKGCRKGFLRASDFPSDFLSRLGLEALLESYPPLELPLSLAFEISRLR